MLALVHTARLWTLPWSDPYRAPLAQSRHFPVPLHVLPVQHDQTDDLYASVPLRLLGYMVTQPIINVGFRASVLIWRGDLSTGRVTFVGVKYVLDLVLRHG